jgi:RNA polymerase sigma factor (sigma-70 family)
MALWRDARTLFAAGTVAGLTDQELLARYVEDRGEAAEVAFASLVARHGPMVLGVCRRILTDPDEAEDAFQATFLVLVRKAGAVEVEKSLAPWLHGVSTRIARRARTRSARRRTRETATVEDLPGSPDPSAERRDLRSVIDEELGRLPDRYRRPVLLCDLGGLSHEQAARELRCPAGTVKSRLSRGRERLRERLARRGLAPEGALLGATLPLRGAVPSGLVQSTCLAASWLKTSRAAGAGVVSTRVAALLKEERGAMFWAKLKTWVLAALLAGCLGTAALTIGSLRAPTGAVGTTGLPRSKEAPREIRGVVLDPDGRPVPGATVVAGSFDLGRHGYQVMTTDAEGRFQWPRPAGAKGLTLIAHKEGFAASVGMAYAPSLSGSHTLTLPLNKPDAYTAALVDEEGKPIAGAKVRVEQYGILHPKPRPAYPEPRPADAPVAFTEGYFRYIPREVIEGSPVEGEFVTTTDENGSFTFRTPGQGTTGLRLRVTAPDGRALWVRPGPAADERTRRVLINSGLIPAPPGEANRLVTVPAARIVGRVVSTLPDVGVSGLTVGYRESYPLGEESPKGNSGPDVLTDSDGRFAFDGLGEGTVDITVRGPGSLRTWTYRRAEDVSLTPGATSEVTIELLRGIEAEGTVVAQGTGAPVAGARVTVSSINGMTHKVTDDRGRYRYRVPSGKVSFHVVGTPRGFQTLPRGQSNRTVTVPEGAASFRVPPIVLAAEPKPGWNWSWNWARKLGLR